MQLQPVAVVVGCVGCVSFWGRGKGGKGLGLNISAWPTATRPRPPGRPKHLNPCLEQPIGLRCRTKQRRHTKEQMEDQFLVPPKLTHYFTGMTNICHGPPPKVVHCAPIAEY